jgi:hypothetical protein
VVGSSDINDVGDYLRNFLPQAVRVEGVPIESVPISWKPPLGRAALCGCRNRLGNRFRMHGLGSAIGSCNDSQANGEHAELWEDTMLEITTEHFGRF